MSNLRAGMLFLVLASQGCTAGGDTQSDATVGVDALVDACDGECQCIAEGEVRGSVQEVDVVWVVDTSASMRQEAPAIRLNLLRFAEAISSRASDHRWILVANANSVQIPDEYADPDRFLAVDVSVSSTDAPEILLETLPSLDGALRPGAVTHIVIVSDDDGFVPTLPGDEATTPEEFRTGLEAQFPQGFQFHAVTSPPEVCETAERSGAAYWDLAEATGGLTVSVCSLDWSSLVDELVDRVTTTSLPCEIPLVPPEGLEIDYDRIDFSFRYQAEDGTTRTDTFPFTDADGCTLPLSGEPRVGWYVDREASEVRLCPRACSELSGAAFLDATVSFGCPPTII